MRKVNQFKSVLSFIDLILNIIIVLAILAGCVALMRSGVEDGLQIIITGLIFWVFKVLGFGISYTLIQIAENTKVDLESVENDCKGQVIDSSFEEQFIELYERNKNSDILSNSIKRTYRKLRDGETVPHAVLEIAIESMSTKT